MTEKMMLVLNASFSSYRTYINLMEKIIPEGSMYKISINKIKHSNGLSTVNISIFDTKYCEENDNKIKLDKYNNNFFNYQICPILTDNLADELIDIIISDFMTNHFINYSSFNKYDKIVTFQNNRFSLNVKLDDERDMIEKKEIHDNNPNVLRRNKVLIINK